jgi:hypothetical protein
MKRLGFVFLLLLWTVLVAVGTVRWVQRNDAHAADPANSIEVSVEPHLKLEGEPWMLSSLRMTRGPGVHVRREELPGGGIRAVVTNASTFGGDTVTIDLTKAPSGSIRGWPRWTGRVIWGRRSLDRGAA